MTNNIIIAKVYHEALRAFRDANNEPGLNPWDEESFENKQSTIDSVSHQMAYPESTPEQQHEQWCEQKRAAGWIYGEVRDNDKKVHPCLVPYNELPLYQRQKDFLMVAIVNALK